MPKTVYKVEGNSPGAPSPGPASPDAGRPRQRTLFWVLLVLLLITLAMIVAIAVLGAGDSGAAATSYLATPSATELDTSTTTTPVASSTTDTPATAPAVVSSTSSSSTTAATISTHAITSPVRIVIPAMKLDAKVVAVGLQKSGAMEIPPVGLVGWYKLGPAPGAAGPAVIVSHVMWHGKKGAFYLLKDLKAGDQVLIYDKSGDVAVFQVDSQETTLKTDLPTERIWNKTTEPVIRLITCGGVYNSASGHFLSNVIVYGHLVK
jgi:sortase (surface protein transpeptidase)